ncbi:MAG: NADH-quinone oxidoreductase subunit H [Cytophagaceae bacterium]|nr:NADH-quinone oxidoreductase subunit H [Cytophagaceae bacterium]
MDISKARIDQLIYLCWKILTPIALIIVVIAVCLESFKMWFCDMSKIIDNELEELFSTLLSKPAEQTIIETHQKRQNSD